MKFFRWLGPEFPLPKPRLRLIVFGLEDTLPCPLQLVHPAGLWGALVGMPTASKQHPNPRVLLEQPMESGEYEFHGLAATVTARVQRSLRGSPTVGRTLAGKNVEYTGMETVARELLIRSQWSAILELKEIRPNVRDAVAFHVDLADRLAVLTDGAVIDQEACRCYLPGKWRVTNALRPVDAREHVSIHLVKDGSGNSWVHSHGLSKFGRPEVEVFDVPAPLEGAAWGLMIDLCQWLMEGTVLRPGDSMGKAQAPLFVRAGGDASRDHFSVPALELVDVGPGGKPLGRGATHGIEAYGEVRSKSSVG